MSGMIDIIVVAMIIVLMAMMVDLVSGLNKAKERGDYRTSTGLKRTLSKFISYEGGMLIAAGIDILLNMCNLFQLFHLDAIYGVPFITCLVGAFLLAVEWKSVREKADEKTKKEFSEAEMMALKILSKRENRELIKGILSLTKEDKMSMFDTSNFEE